MLHELKRLTSKRFPARVVCMTVWVEGMGWLAWDIHTGAVTAPRISQEAAMAAARNHQWERES